MKMIGKYTNGDYSCLILSDGTKIRVNDKDSFNPAFPESMDIKITNMCDMGCPYCHEDSKPDGQHGNILGAKFIDNLHPYTELAIGGGNPLKHPDLPEFLEKCKALKLIPSMTVNQEHFMKEYKTLRYLTNENLIYGLGVSLRQVTDDFLEKVSTIPNAVIHVIAGVVSHEQMVSMYGKGLKILILGYKQFRRGNQYFSSNETIVSGRIKSMEERLPEYFKHFKVVSFDNLAVEQLRVRSKLSQKTFDEMYMGDDGQFTMYVDLVKGEFAKSSTSTKRRPIGEYEHIEDMFNIIRKDVEDEKIAKSVRPVFSCQALRLLDNQVIQGWYVFDEKEGKHYISLYSNPHEVYEIDPETLTIDSKHFNLRVGYDG